MSGAAQLRPLEKDLHLTPDLKSLKVFDTTQVQPTRKISELTHRIAHP